METRIDRLKTQLKQMDNACECMSSEITYLEEHGQELQREKQAAVDGHAKLRETWDLRMDEMRELKHDSVKLRLDLATRTADLEKSKRRAKQSQENRQIEMKGANFSIENQKNQINQLNEEKLALEQENMRLKEKLSDLQSEHDKNSDGLLKQLQDLKTEKEAAQEQKESLRENLRMLEKEARELKGVTGELAGNYDEITAQLVKEREKSGEISQRLANFAMIAWQSSMRYLDADAANNNTEAQSGVD